MKQKKITFTKLFERIQMRKSTHISFGVMKIKKNESFADTDDMKGILKDNLTAMV